MSQVRVYCGMKNDDGSSVPPFKPPRYQPCRCALCRECWFDTKYRCCIYGGPFTGFVFSTR